MAIRVSEEVADRLGSLTSIATGESAGNSRRVVAFTDLDGTLIDFETYSPAAATPAVQSFLARGGTLVFCSSKTLGEQRAIMREMGISVPAIVENGSGIFLPDDSGLEPETGDEAVETEGGRIIELGTPAREIRAAVATIERNLGIDLGTYRHLSIAEIVARTGLDTEAAARARNRDFSETLTAQLDADTWERVERHLEAAGLRLMFGGRFRTVTATGCDKGRAVERFMRLLAEGTSDSWHSIGLGDSANDREMLAAVDEAFLVQRPDGTWAEMALSNVTLIDGIGPAGWVKAVEWAMTPFLTVR